MSKKKKDPAKAESFFDEGFAGPAGFEYHPSTGRAA
jgi:hypothetical protein